MPIIPDAVKRVTPSKEDKAKAPHTRVRSGGKVGRRLRTLADMYIALHQDQDVRFVYFPENKPELSNVTSRHIDGYRMCYVKDLGDVAELSDRKFRLTSTTPPLRRWKGSKRSSTTLSRRWNSRKGCVLSIGHVLEE